MRQLMCATALSIALTSLLAGCGGGGGGSPTTSSNSGSSPTSTCSTCVNVSGISGAPVAAGQVTIKGSGAGETPIKATLDSNGMKSIDVKSLTAPYLIQVTGTVNGALAQYVSLATASDRGATVSVSPLTNLVVAKAASEDANTWFNNPVNQSTVASNLSTAAQQVTAVVLPILQQIDPTVTDASKVDLLHFDPTKAGFHSKLDGLLDVINVTAQPNSNQVTITYKADSNNTVTVSDDLNTPSTLTAPPANEDASALTADLTAIQAQVTKLQNLVATSLPTATQLSPLFDVANFLDEGQDFQAFVAQLPQDVIGAKITNISIAKIIDASHLVVRLSFVAANGDMGDPHEWHVNNVNGTWLFAGDQRQNVFMSVRSEEVTEGGGYASGIRFNVSPSNDTFGQSIDHAVITGPGLPSNGITLTKNGTSWMLYANTGNGDNLLLFDGCQNVTSYVCAGTGSSISAITDNSVYNVKLYDVNNNILNGSGYDELLAKAPLMVSALNSNSFATFNAPSGLSPTSVTISWNLPAGMASESANIHVGASSATGAYVSGNEYVDMLTPTAVSWFADLSNLNLPAAPTSIYESVVVQDPTGLQFRTNDNRSLL